MSSSPTSELERNTDPSILSDLMEMFADPHVDRLTHRAAKEIARLDALAEALRTRVAELEGEKEEARAAAGLGCDANAGAAHEPMKDGRYTFCTKCGETLTQPDLRERARAAEASLAQAQQQLERAVKVIEPFAKADRLRASYWSKPDDTPIAALGDVTIGHFRAAHDLHASLTGGEG